MSRCQCSAPLLIIMAGSRSQSIIDSVEKFWKTEMNPLSYDNNIKILTAGVKNMYSIAQCAEDLISENDGTKAYLTYQRLVKVLDFVWKGAQSLQNIVLKSDPSREPQEDLSDTFEVFREVLDTLKCKPPREEMVKDTNKIPNSSAIELLLELFYKTTPEVPENICT